MKKILLIVVLAVVAGGGYMAYQSSLSGTSSTGGAGEFTSAPVGATAFSGSVADLMAKGDSVQCTLPQGAAKLYVAGGKFRFDVAMKTSQTSIEKHSMFDGKTIYSWDSQTSSGTKKSLNFDGLKKADRTFEAQTTGYLCAPWKVDSAFFVPPAGVSFTEAK